MYHLSGLERITGSQCKNAESSSIGANGRHAGLGGTGSRTRLVPLEASGNPGWPVERIRAITSFCVNGGHHWVIDGREAFPKGPVGGSGTPVGPCPRIRILSPNKDLEHQDGGRRKHHGCGG